MGIFKYLAKSSKKSLCGEKHKGYSEFKYSVWTTSGDIQSHKIPILSPPQKKPNTFQIYSVHIKKIYSADSFKQSGAYVMHSSCQECIVRAKPHNPTIHNSNCLLKLRLPVLHSAHLSESIYIHDNHHPYNSTATLSPTSDVCDSDVKTERSE